MARLKLLISAACLVAELAVASLYEPPKTHTTSRPDHNASQTERAMSLPDSINHAENHVEATNMITVVPVR